MKRLLPGLLLTGLLAACAPLMQGGGATEGSAAPAGPPALQASFSPAGVIWLEGGQVTLARAPDFQKLSVRLPGSAAAVAWQRSGDTYTPWAALKSAGLILTADARPRSVPVGRVAALSRGRVYREDGSAVNYDGTPADSGLLGAPDAVQTGSDDLEYARQGSRLYRLDSGGPALLSSAARPFLSAAALAGGGEFGGVESTLTPTLFTPAGRYTLTGTALERRDAAGVLRASVAHGPGVVGAVGSVIVTVGVGGALRVFAPELREVGR